MAQARDLGRPAIAAQLGGFIQALHRQPIVHSIANFFYFQLAALLGAPLGWTEWLHDLAPVIVGNIAGGSVLVALVYYFVYIRPARTKLVGK